MMYDLLYWALLYKQDIGPKPFGALELCVKDVFGMVDRNSGCCQALTFIRECFLNSSEKFEP